MALFFGEREITPAIITQGSGGDIVTATNNTGSTINSGDKVWINKVGNNYELINFVSQKEFNNFSIYGSPSITAEGTAGNFSSYNYLRLPYPFRTNNKIWEMVFKVKTPNSISNQKVFHANVSDSYSGRYGIGINYGYNGSKFGLFVSSDGYNWLFDITGSISVATSTDCWIKVGWNGETYYLDISTDGINYTRDITYNSANSLTDMISNAYIGIYKNGNTEGAWEGLVYLQDSYIKIDNKIWWEAFTQTINVDETILTGFAKENIPNNSLGSVLTILPS